MKRVLLEGLFVAAVGAVVAFAANRISPRGLKLGVNYFPVQEVAVPLASTNAAIGTVTNAVEQLTARLKAEGLQVCDSNRVTQLFHDPRLPQNLIVFIDARDEQHYSAGHIPGAWLFDRFQPQNYLATVLPACQIAQEIVVYCNGGDCDDSAHAAVMLRDMPGIGKDKLVVYGGGLNEWATNRMPVETGQRNSGQMLPQTK